MTGESRMNAPQTPTNPKEAMMACKRCHGLMVKETLFNPGEGLPTRGCRSRAVSIAAMWRMN